jgi:hypothetical protein
MNRCRYVAHCNALQPGAEAGGSPVFEAAGNADTMMSTPVSAAGPRGRGTGTPLRVRRVPDERPAADVRSKRRHIRVDGLPPSSANFDASSAKLTLRGAAGDDSTPRNRMVGIADEAPGVEPLVVTPNVLSRTPRLPLLPSA